MAQAPANPFKKDIIANAATLPASSGPATTAAATANANPANHILPTSALMAGLCVLIMAQAKLVELRTGSGLMDLAMGVNCLLFLLSAIGSFVSMRLAGRAGVMERLSDAVFVLGVLLLAVSGVAFAVDLI